MCVEGGWGAGFGGWGVEGGRLIMRGSRDRSSSSGCDSRTLCRRSVEGEQGVVLHGVCEVLGGGGGGGRGGGVGRGGASVGTGRSICVCVVPHTGHTSQAWSA